jgi:aryl-alcohol dehydrogenase-like predicted oxidoreductase
MSTEDRARIVGHAIDRGVTYFDTTFGAELKSLAESLRILKRRDGLFISGMFVDFFNNFLKDNKDNLNICAHTRREVEKLLTQSGIDYIDQIMMGALETGDPLDHPKSIMEDAFYELYKMRDEGKLGFVGFSCHDPDYAARLLDAYPNFDSVMTPYNFSNRVAEDKLADAIKKTGVAWIAMKPLVWQFYGITVTTMRNLRPVPGRLEFDPTVQIGRLAIQFILSNPLITTTVPAVNSVEAVDENVAASGAPPLSEEDIRHLEQYAKAMAAENQVPLAIAGLLSDNARIHSMAIMLTRMKLGIESPPIDWETDQSEAQACETAARLVKRLAADPKWADLIS